MKERILCAAIWFEDGEKNVHQPKNITTGFVVCGRRHHNCIAIVDVLGESVIGYKEHIQGFLTSEDRFVDRKEGAKIAYAAQQTKEFESPLFSEDLY